MEYKGFEKRRDINHRDFATTDTSDEFDDVHLGNIGDDISSFVNGEFERFSTQRQEAEENWLEAWSLYLGTPEAVNFQRQQVLSTVGEVNADWRHRINTGKAFEVVETIHGYLMSATFPNNEWFSVVPSVPGVRKLARVVRKYMASKLHQGKFRANFENFLRQLLITGNSVMALPWRYETIPWKRNVRSWVREMNALDGTEEVKEQWKKVTESRIYKNHPDFETLDMFDCFLDPTATDPNEAAFIRRLTKTKAEVIKLIDEGYYKGLTGYDIACLEPTNRVIDDNEKNALRHFQGVATDEAWRMGDTITILEYWGDAHTDERTYHDICATVIGDTTVRFEPNPFWCGKPFVIGTAITLTQTPYAVGTVQPNMGLLHQLNIITNQRLDNIELAIDEMWTLKQGSVLQANEVYSAPGKVFLVSEHDDIKPVQRGNNNFTVTYQEAGLLEQTIDKNSGTGALISANNARTGERVTAAEVQATRDAGGNRLSNLHKHIEDTALIPILSKVYRLAQQFVTETEVVEVAGEEPGDIDYWEVEPEDLQYDMKLKPIGADHVTDKSRYIKDRLEFLQAVAQIPQMAPLVNYEAILLDLVNHFGFDDPDKYVVTKDAQAQAPADPEADPNMPPETSEMEQQLQNVGGKAMSQMFNAEMAKDGGAELAMNTFGIDVNAAMPQGM